MTEIKPKLKKLRLEGSVREFAIVLNDVFKDLIKLTGTADQKTILKAAIYAALMKVE